MANELPQKDSEKQAISDLYPSLSGEELREAEENLKRYVRVALEIQKERFPERPGQVDSGPHSSTMKERSNVSLKD